MFYASLLVYYLLFLYLMRAIENETVRASLQQKKRNQKKRVWLLLVLLLLFCLTFTSVARFFRPNAPQESTDPRSGAISNGSLEVLETKDGLETKNKLLTLEKQVIELQTKVQNLIGDVTTLTENKGPLASPIQNTVFPATITHDLYNAYENLNYYQHIDAPTPSSFLTRGEIEGNFLGTKTELADLGDVIADGLESGKILEWNGTNWAPTDDKNTDTNTTYSAGSGLNLSSTTFSVNQDYDFAWTGAQSWTNSANFHGDLSIADADITFDGSATNLAMTGNFSVNSTDLFVQKFDGNIGVGTSAPTSALDVVGRISASDGIRTADDFYVGVIGLSDFADGPLLSGASLIGVSDQFINSNATDLQTVLTDLDTAITGAAHPPVTLAGDYDYLTLSNQEISLKQIDLSTDVTGTLPLTNVTGILSLASGGTNANLSAATLGGLIYKGVSALEVSGSLTGILKGNGSSAPTAMTGDTNYVTRWTDAHSIGTGLLYDDLIGVGVGTTSPGAKLDVVGGNIRTDGDLYAGQLYLGYDETAALVTTVDADEALTLDPNGLGNLYFHGASYYLDSQGLTLLGGLATPGFTPTAGEIRADIFRDGDSTYYLQPADTAIAGVFAGNIGIGTTTPDFALQVNGVIAPESSGLDLGTDSLRWDMFAGTLNANSTVTLSGLGTGVDNTVLILNSSNEVATREIDPRVWSGVLSGGSGSTGYVAYWTDTDTLSAEQFLSVTRGGLGNDITALGAGEIIYSTGTTSYDSLAAGNSGFILASGGAGAPTWVDPSTLGTNYWKSTAGVLSPLLGEPLAATSSATTVGTFTATGTNTALQTGGETSYAQFSSSGNLIFTNTSGSSIDATAELTIGGSTQTGLVLGRSGISTKISNLITDGVVYTSGGDGTLNTETQLAITRGGTNSTASPTAGAVAYGTGSAYDFSLAGTIGQALLSGGTGTPTWGTLGLTYGGTNADLSAVATGGLIYKGATALVGTEALTGILQGNGSSAPSAISGTPGYLPRWSAAAPYLTTTSNIFDDGTNIGIGTTSPDYKLQVDGTITPESSGLDLGTNSLRWDLFAATLNANSTVTLSGLGTGVDNTVLILNSSNEVTTDEIDSRVWGDTLVDGLGVAGYVPYWTDTDTLSAEQFLSVTRGGLGNDITALGAGEIIYSTGTTSYDSLAAGTAGYFLQSNGAGAPSWVDPGVIGYTGWTIAGDSGTSQLISSSDTLTIAGGGGLTSVAANFDLLTLAVGAGDGISVATDSVAVDQAYTFSWTGAQSWSNTADFNGDISIADTDITMDGASTNLNPTGDFSINSTNFYVNKTTGNVGVGAASANQTLEVTGNVRISDLTPLQFVKTNANNDLVSAGAIDLSSLEVTGVLPLTNGGTNANLSAVSGGIVYSDADSFEITGAGTAGQALLSAGTGTPAWGTLGLTHGGTNTNLSTISTGGLIYKGATALAGSGSLTGVVKGNGSSAPTAMTGIANYVTRWTDAESLGVGILYDDGTNVGIGTTIPVGKLHVEGAAVGKALVILNETGDQDIFTASASGNTRLRLTTDGHIIPGADDSQDLGSSVLRWQDLYLGANTLHIGSSLTDEGTISYDTTGNIFNFGTDSTTNADIAFFTDDLYLDKSSGNVGIGTITPERTFDVALNIDGFDGQRITNSNTGTSAVTALTLMNSASGSISIGKVGENTTAFSGYGAANDAFMYNSNTGGGNLNIINAYASGQINFFTNGNAASGADLTIDSTGNVGIGTDTPNLGKLVVITGTDLNSGITLYRGAGTSSRIWKDSSDKLMFSTGGALDIMTMQTNGNVGIGDTTPNAPLTIKASSTADQAVYQTWRYSQSGSDQYSLKLKQTVTSGVVRYTFDMINNNTAYNNVLTLDRGNVGIGTTSPSQLLDVNGNIQLTGGDRQIVVGSGYLDVRPNDNAHGIILRDYTGGSTIWSTFRTVNDTTDYLQIGMNTTTNGLYITDGDNVGIGTSAPGQKLDVAGNISTNGQLISTKATGTAPLSVTSTTLVSKLNADLLDGQHSSYFMPTTTDNWVNVTGDTMSGDLSFGSATRQMINLYSTSYGIGVQSNTQYFRTATNFAWFKGGVHSGTALNPGTDGTAQMVLNTNGNLGIGTTSPNQKLHVVGVINATTGYRINNAATNGSFLRGNGTNFVASTNGSTLTSLNATNLSSGTVANARISGAYSGITTLAVSGTLTLSSTGSDVINLSGSVTSNDNHGIAFNNRTALSADSDGWLRLNNGDEFTSGTFISGTTYVGSKLGVTYSNPSQTIQIDDDTFGNSSGWINSSDRNKKENFTKLSDVSLQNVGLGTWEKNGAKIDAVEYEDGFAHLTEGELLNRLELLPLYRYNYISDTDTNPSNPGGVVYHISPIAQDFYKLFGLSSNDTRINATDIAGIALAGIKAMKHKIDHINFESDTGLIISESDDTYTLTATPTNAKLTNVLAAAEVVTAKLRAGLTTTKQLVVEQTATIADLSVSKLTISGQSLSEYIRDIVQFELQNQPTPLPTDAIDQEFYSDTIINNYNTTLTVIEAPATASAEVASEATATPSLVATPMLDERVDILTTLISWADDATTGLKSLFFEVPTVFRQLAWFQGPVKVNADTSGSLNIPGNTAKARVSFSKPFPEIPNIHVTFNNTSGAISHTLSDINQSGFTITFAEPPASEISMQWLALLRDESQAGPSLQVIEMADGQETESTLVPPPSPTPTSTPSPNPTPTPTPSPLISPTPTPLASPTPTPLASPAPSPLASPSPTPTSNSTFLTELLTATNSDTATSAAETNNTQP